MDVGRSLGNMVATALWVVAVTLMVTAGLDGASLILIGWSLLSALSASVVTVWQMVERSRGRVMDYLSNQDLRVSAAVTDALRSNREGRPTQLH